MNRYGNKGGESIIGRKWFEYWSGWFSQFIRGNTICNRNCDLHETNYIHEPFVEHPT